jgi:hypothetical protein
VRKAVSLALHALATFLVVRSQQLLQGAPSSHLPGRIVLRVAAHDDCRNGPTLTKRLRPNLRGEFLSLAQ